MYRGKHLPKFGPYQEERNKIKIKLALESDLLVQTPKAEPAASGKVPTVNEQIGKAVPRIGDYNSLNNKQQVFHFLAFLPFPFLSFVFPFLCSISRVKLTD